jgi:hypothetical protein
MSTLPPKPRYPAHLTAQEQRMAVSLITMASTDLEAVLGDLTRAKTPAELADEARYDAEVAAYNAAVDAHNAPIKAAREAREAARERAAVYAATCERCFTVHPAGECY